MHQRTVLTLESGRMRVFSGVFVALVRSRDKVGVQLFFIKELKMRMASMFWLIFSAALILGFGQNLSGQEESLETTSRSESPQLSGDALRVAVQKICPVTGEQLGSHGDPFVATMGDQGQQVYLCCEACATRKPDPKHWKTIMNNLAKAQNTCPVMKHDLPNDPDVVVVEGRAIFICCPPCADDIKADPTQFISIVDGLYEKSMIDSVELTGDRLAIAVQQICPVSGDRLDSRGEPIKVEIGEQQQEVFLCCEECTTKPLNADHWATIHINMAKAQQFCPVMKLQLPEGAQWTVVNGHVIFVCCPPCIEKIQADPDSHIQQLEQRYREALKSKKR